jgi:crossover junction endodeoxyribonuclease RusA
MILYSGKIDVCWEGRIRLAAYVFPPDKRARDLDNILKVPMDAMQKMGVYKNDSQIDELLVFRENVDKNHPRILFLVDELNREGNV